MKIRELKKKKKKIKHLIMLQFFFYDYVFYNVKIIKKNMRTKF